MMSSDILNTAAQPLYKVGIYCRLSIDDASNVSKKYVPADESTSIENQKNLLSHFVMLNGWLEVQTYIDDGYSGANFQRPGFLQMLEDARKGLINLILVKDLSRLGRDFVEVGRYTDEIFPALGCRFVSLLDCLDSESDNTDMIHFRSLMNDYHLKDLSSKIKSVLVSRKKNGIYASSHSPYGYRKSEDGKELVIDEPAAKVVRRIYDMRRKGIAYGKIAAALNIDGIPCPRAYRYDSYGKDKHKPSTTWLYASVKNILTNEVYLGTTILNRLGTLSYKTRKMIKKPEAEWIRHDNAHEAIISREVWDAVQAINIVAKQKAGKRTSIPKLFSGKLVCADCKGAFGAHMDTRQLKSGTQKVYISYFCARFALSGRCVCSSHRVSERALIKIVINEIKSYAEALTLDESSVVNRLNLILMRDKNQHMEQTSQEIAKLRRRLNELENAIAKLYEDKVCGIINESTFSMLAQKKDHERIATAERLEVLLSEVNEIDQRTSDVQNWTAAVRKYCNIHELTRDIIDELIDHIEIGERTFTDGVKHQDIKVFYKFVGAVN